MKSVLKAKTRWEYRTSHIAGLTLVLGLILLCGYLTVKDGKIDFTSIPFWLGVVMVILYPFGLVSLLSSMDEVAVSQNGLRISYKFKKHVTEILFSDVRTYSSNAEAGATDKSSSLRDVFTITMNDGRVFEFSRSQFENYDRLKSFVKKSVRV